MIQWRTFNIHGIIQMHKRFIFTLRKNGSFKNCSLKSYLRNPKCLFYAKSFFWSLYFCAIWAKILHVQSIRNCSYFLSDVWPVDSLLSVPVAWPSGGLWWNGTCTRRCLLTSHQKSSESSFCSPSAPSTWLGSGMRAQGISLHCGTRILE